MGNLSQLLSILVISVRRQKAEPTPNPSKEGNRRQEAGGSTHEKNFTTMHENSFLRVSASPRPRVDFKVRRQNILRFMVFVFCFLLTDGLLPLHFTTALSGEMNSSGIIGSQTKQQNRSTVDRILDIFRRKPKDGGSRRDSFCPIWPNGNDPYLLEIWSNSPLFIWQGTVREIEVRLPGSESALWHYEVGTNQQQLLYQGPELQPGEYDYWVMYEVTEGGETTTDSKTIPFIIMEERETIANELMGLEEETVLARAEFFADQELWSDFLREVFGVANPSVAWQENLEAIRKESCNK
ncbi:MAG: hypothetical protein F6K47_30790 [Symploca sp. SIO2E6]|nr:hypothetical protein [Symploca sp. SIO2E6]